MGPLGSAWLPHRGRPWALRRSVDNGRSCLADDSLATFGFLIYAAVGGLIVIRRDGHLTGWLLISIGLAVLFADGLAGLPAVSPLLADWVSSWGWSLVFCLFALLT